MNTQVQPVPAAKLDMQYINRAKTDRKTHCSVTVCVQSITEYEHNTNLTLCSYSVLENRQPEVSALLHTCAVFGCLLCGACAMRWKALLYIWPSFLSNADFSAFSFFSRARMSLKQGQDSIDHTVSVKHAK